jgi:TolB protein
MARIRPSRPSLAVALLAGVSLLATARPALAQDPQPPGVTIIGNYDPRAKPGVLVLPITGAAGDSVRAILMRDLDFGDRVTVIGNPAAPAESPVPAGSRTNYPLYARLGAAAVVQASLTSTGLAVSVHDVAKQRVARTRSIPLTASPNSADWRLELHGVSDELEQWITGQRGIASSLIAYTRGDNMYVTHSDGAVTTTVPTGEGRPMSPSWGPEGRFLVFARMGDAGTEVLMRDLVAGRTRTISERPSLNSTPTVSPDGRWVVYSHAPDAETNLYIMSIDGGTRRRITVGGSINTSPSFSPDGRRVAFASGRTGRPEIWTADVEGGGVEPLTPFLFGERVDRANPSWSPDNRQVAFQSDVAGRYQIVTITLRDRNVRQHTSDGINEDPSWAPDGRHLVFVSTRSGSRQLWVLDTESGRMRQLTRGASGARMPAWSGRLGGSGAAGTPSGEGTR